MHNLYSFANHPIDLVWFYTNPNINFSDFRSTYGLYNFNLVLILTKTSIMSM